jgi:hypothetical protein
MFLILKVVILGTMSSFRAVPEFHVGLLTSVGFGNYCATSLEQEGRVGKEFPLFLSYLKAQIYF